MTIALKSALDPRAFRRALGQFPTGVCVVTCLADSERVGMTMSSFNSLSLDPPLILFSIDRRAASLLLWERAESYVVNILAENQREVSNRFARPHSNKWEGARLAREGDGPPALAGAAAIFDCAPWAIHDGGDHKLFLARVTQFWSNPDRKPLIFSQGHYASLEPTEFAAPLWPLDSHY